MSRVGFNELYDRAAVAAFVIIGSAVGGLLWQINEKTTSLVTTSEVTRQRILNLETERVEKNLFLKDLEGRLRILEKECKRK